MFSQTNIGKLVASARAVYDNYLALEFVNKGFQDGESSLAAQIEKVLRATDKSPTEINTSLGGEGYTCRLTPRDLDGEDVTYDVAFPDFLMPEDKVPEAILPLTQYSPAQKKKIFKRTPFFVRKNSKTNTYAFGIVLEHNGKKIEIGGPDKISLYAAHVVSLGYLIKELEKSRGRKPVMLAALATGSGKSFVQALWALVLHLAGVKGVFAAPATLVTQLRQDMGRLLPESVIREIGLERNLSGQAQAREKKKEEGDEADIEVKKGPGRQSQGKEEKGFVLGQEPQADKSITLVSHDRFFSPSFAARLNKDFMPEDTFLSFDEQHVISEKENWHIKLRRYLQKYNALLLTATPTRNSFQLAGNAAVISGSKKKKVLDGTAVPSESMEAVAPTMHAKIASSRASWFSKKIYSLLASFANALVTEVVSPVSEMLHQVRYSFVARPLKPGEKKPSLRDFLRWHVAIPGTEKMLIVTHDHDTLINLDRGLEDKDVAQSIYSDGNLVVRTDIYNAFVIDNVEDVVVQEHANKKREMFRLQLQDCVRRAGYEVKSTEENQLLQSFIEHAAPPPPSLEESKGLPDSMANRAENIIFMSVVDNALQELLGCDLLTLDERRRHGMQHLVQDVHDKMHTYEKKQEVLEAQYIKEGLDLATAAHLAKDVLTVIAQFKKNAWQMKKLVDNWHHDAPQNRRALFGSDFNWRSHHKRFLFKDLEKNLEEKVEDNCVYSAMQETAAPLRLPNGDSNPQTKNRARNAIETLNPRAQEYSYAPLPDVSMTPDQAKAAFKRGLIPYMIGNTMVEGFNDVNLQVTVNIVSSTADVSNQPAKKIQACGRTRALNKHKIPINIDILNDGVETLFSLKSLDKDDYIPDFLSGTEKYNQKILDNQGRKMARQVKDWIYAQLEKQGHVDAEQLNQYVFSLSCQAILELNKGNDHHLARSRQQFLRVLQGVQNEIRLTQYQLRNTYTLSRMVCWIGNLLNWAAWRAYGGVMNQAYLDLGTRVQAMGEEKNEERWDARRAHLYHKIVGRDFPLMQKNAMVFNMMGDLLKAEVAKIEKEAKEKGEALIDQNEVAASVNRNAEAALKKAKKKQSDDSDFGEACDDLILALKDQKDAEEIFPVNQLTAPVLQEKVMTLLQESKNAKAKAALKKMKPENLPLLAKALKEQIDDNTVESDARASANISSCKSYSTLLDLVMNPLLLGIVENTLSGYTTEELELLLANEHPEEKDPDKISERVERLSQLLKELVFYRGNQVERNFFEDKYIKYFRNMKGSRQVLEDLSDLFQAQYKCHTYFHGVDKTGTQINDDQHRPALIQGLALEQYRVKRENVTGIWGQLRQHACKIFFLQAVRRSLPEVNVLKSIAMDKHAKHLQQVADQIIAPLQTSMGNSGFSFFRRAPSDQQKQKVQEFAKQLKNAKPLTFEEAEAKEHCLVGLLQPLPGK